MNDRAVNLLEKYDVEVHATRKGRGVILCDSNLGTLCLQEYNGLSERLQVVDRITRKVTESGIPAQVILRTKEDELFVEDGDHVRYLLKTFPVGRELNVRDNHELKDAVRLMAALHRELASEDPGVLHAFSVTGEYEKRNKELIRIKKYLRSRGQKTAFEVALSQHMEEAIGKAQEVLENWKSYENKISMDDTVKYCHGDFQYHHLIYEEKGLHVINFEKITEDRQIRDLYYFLRKIMEKNDWNPSLGQELLQEYEKEYPIDFRSMIDLYYRFSYPEKFWKIANYYMNAPKSFIPMKNLEKLEVSLQQESLKEAFIKDLLIIHN